jgi:hypothetical protein
MPTEFLWGGHKKMLKRGTISLSQTMKNMKKCFIWVVIGQPHPWANNPTMTNFNEWLDLNPKGVYSTTKPFA